MEEKIVWPAVAEIKREKFNFHMDGFKITNIDIYDDGLIQIIAEDGNCWCSLDITKKQLQEINKLIKEREEEDDM